MLCDGRHISCFFEMIRHVASKFSIAASAKAFATAEAICVDIRKADATDGRRRSGGIAIGIAVGRHDDVL